MPNAKYVRVLTIALGALVLPEIAGSASASQLKGLWPIVTSTAPFNASKAKCAAIPAPVLSLATASRYDQSDDARTIVDPARSKAYEAEIAPVRAFSKLVISEANEYALSGGKKQSAAYCAAAALTKWAQSNAMVKAETDIANFNRATFLAAVASAHIQISGSNQFSTKQRDVVEGWMLNLSEATRKFYQAKREAKTVKPNNIQYWAAFAVATTAVALNRPDDLKWGVEGMALGACTATPEGALPREIERKDRALHYHLFALQPLIALAELAEQNGMEGYSVCGGSLQRIVDFTLNAATDPKQIEQLAGAQQLDWKPPTASDIDFSWLEIYAARFPDFGWSKQFAKLKPFANTNLGGKLTQLYERH
jgi:poly(beta-D-mannuronate) lyase